MANALYLKYVTINRTEPHDSCQIVLLFDSREESFTTSKYERNVTKTVEYDQSKTLENPRKGKETMEKERRKLTSRFLATPLVFQAFANMLPAHPSPSRKVLL